MTEKTKNMDGEEEKVFKVLYFATAEMKNSFIAWPEIIFVDTVYNLLRRKLPVILVVLQDSNNMTQIVAVGILSDESSLTLEAFFNIFRSENEEACAKVKCIMTDKDLTERKVIKQVFPHASLYLCQFHVLKVFSRTITRSQMKITTAERKVTGIVK